VVETELQLVVFRLGEQSFAVPIAQVREVVAAGELTPMPGWPPYLAGVLVLRGAVLPVVELRTLLELAGEAPARRQVVVVERPDAVFGLLVDGVSQVLRLGPEGLEPPPQVAGARGFLAGVARTEAGLVLVLQLDRLLDRGELSALAASVRSTEGS
jgi:purine-binding chemotaxis protein CheW